MLVTRKCICSCGLTFRSLKPAYFYSLGHAEFASSRKDEVGELARAYILKSRGGFGAGKSPNSANKKARRRYYATEFNPETDELDFIEPEEF